MNKLKKKNNFLEKYFSDLAEIIKPDTECLKKLTIVKDLIVSTSKKSGKTLIFGNGGSAAIASHVSVDLTKNARIRTVNFNEADLITCFSNEGNKWRSSKISFIEKNTLEIKISEKFVGERGRINCSLRETDGFWRWLGIQFVVSEK